MTPVELQLKRLRDLIATNRIIASSLDFDEVLQHVVQQTAAFTGAAACVLLLFDPHWQARVATGTGVDLALGRAFRAPADEQLGTAVRRYFGLADDHRFTGVPVVDTQGVQGVLAVYRQGCDPAPADDEFLLSALADQVAIALRHATLHQGVSQDLQQIGAKLEAALASMTDAVFISDTEGRFIHVNEAFATFHRFRNKAECAKTLDEYPLVFDLYLADGTLVPLEQWPVSRALRGETVVEAEYSLRRNDTGETWEGSYNFAPIRDPDGTIVGSVVTARDITERKRTEEALKAALVEARFARVDPLTGIANRAGFEDRLTLVFAQAKRRGRRFALISLDLDDFKPINDHCGHPVGDQVLKDIAALLTKNCRVGDLAGRYGGDEFTVLLAEIPDAATARTIAERICDGIAAMRWSGHAVSASLGVALFPDHSREVVELTRLADGAMYASKAAGKNRVTLAPYPEPSQAHRRAPSIPISDRAEQSTVSLAG